VALDIDVKDEQGAKTTRTTVPNRAGMGATVGMTGAPGYELYGNSPLYSRLPVRGLNGFDLSTLDFLEMDPLAAIELLPLIFPDASLAVHNILRLGNPGWQIKCFNVKSTKEDKTASKLCREMFERANRGVDCDIPGAMGGPDALINSLLFNAYLKGAVCGETVLDETLTILDDIVAVDPFTMIFEEREEKRGRYRMFQAQTAKRFGEKPNVQTMPSQSSTDNSRVELNPNLITYVPLDETLYGRPMIAPAIQLLVFWTRYYVALQVFLHNIAFGDKDGEIDTNLLLTILDRNMTPQERVKWERDFWGELVKLIGLFANDYKDAAKRDPNSAMIHSDLLKMSALGTARTAYPVEEVMKVCKREIYAALKMLPVLMGANDTVTESHATVQMAIFTSGLSYIQGAVKHVIERALYTGLRASGYGKNVRVEFIFDELSLTDRKKLADAVATELDNEAFKRDQGWITQDEASENSTGSPAICDGPNGEPAANPDPRYVGLRAAGDSAPEGISRRGTTQEPATNPDGTPAEPAPAGKTSRRRGKPAYSGSGSIQLSLDIPLSGNHFRYSTNAPGAVSVSESAGVLVTPNGQTVE
jgi:hypothetical protein